MTTTWRQLGLTTGGAAAQWQPCLGLRVGGAVSGVSPSPFSLIDGGAQAMHAETIENSRNYAKFDRRRHQV
jgi:hypothetical protein